MDRQLLIVSTVCFLAAIVRTILSVRARTFQPSRFSFLAIGLGFIFQTAFLSVRGHALGRCPLTNLFEVFIFLAWSIGLIYMLVGPAYRLSLMGAFTAPLVFLIQAFALIAPIDVRHAIKLPPNPWLEFHASISLIAYGTDLFAAITRLLWFGFALYTLGLISGFFTGRPLPRLQMICAFGVWILYAAILQGRHLRRVAPKRIAALCIIGFSAALTLLWGITFSAQTHSLP